MNILKVFTDYRFFEIFILGIFSGMPFSIVGTLGAWLKEAGVPIAIISTFIVGHLPYSFKVFWSPAVDYFKIPVLSRYGHRKSWMLLCAIVNSAIFLLLSQCSPNNSLAVFYFLIISLGVFSATFDINFDAFRIDKLEKESQGIGAANATFGYRLGMLVSGAGAFEIAHLTSSWVQTFLVLSAIYALSIIFIFTVQEQEASREKLDKLSLNSFSKLTIYPLKDFFSKEGAKITLLAIVFFKLGDAMLGSITTPFYLEIGFNKHQIAVAVKFFGFIATILGCYTGGFLVYKIGYFKGMIITGILQSVNNLVFVWLYHQGADFNSLLITIALENFGGGMGATALVAYISFLCNKKYSATQYALLSSVATFFNNSLTMYGGSLVKQLGWDNYFIFTAFLGLPGILLFVYLSFRGSKQ